MDEQIQDVQADPSPVEEQVAPEVVVAPVEPTPQEDVEVEPEIVAEPVVEPVKDDRPIENLYWEQKRKVDALDGKFDQLLERLPQAGQAQTAGPQQYTKAQLRAFAETQPEHKVWAYEEMDKLDKAERSREMKNIFTQYKTQTDGEVVRQQAYGWVQNNPSFSDCFVKDANGNVQGWNPSSPLTRKIGEYMNRPEFANSPAGIQGAAKMAAFDLGITPGSSKKIDKVTGQLRKEQKKQLASSGGSTPAGTKESASKARVTKLQEEYARTGNKDVFAEMIKLRGMNPFL